MPQYELDAVGPDAVSGRARGRTPEEAIRRAVSLGDDAEVRIDEDTDLQGWCTVHIDGLPSGRVRLHQRMQFRRD